MGADANAARRRGPRVVFQHMLKTQGRLKAALDRYEQLYDFGPVGYLTLDAAGVIRDINATGRQLLGRPRKSPASSPLVNFIAEADRPKLLTHLRLCREQSRRVSTELQLAPRCGASLVWLELISRALRTEKRGQPEYHCALLDITERKQAEHSRQDSETRFRRLADSVPALIWVCDADKTCVYLNRRWRQFAGGPLERQFADGWAAGIHPGERRDCRRIFRAFFDARAEFQAEYRRRNGDGHYHWVLDRGVPLYSSKDEFRGYVGSCIDITDRKRLEDALSAANDKMEKQVRFRTRQLQQANAVLLREIKQRRQTEIALRESEERLADFFERSPLPLLWAGPDGHIRRVNQAWIELSGQSRPECLDRHLVGFFSDAKTTANLLRQLRRKEVIHNQRVRLRRIDGEVRHCNVDADGLWEKGRLIYSRWFVRDITQRVRMEQEILHATENEQRRIGHDLHDDLCQQLTGIEYLSQSLATRLSKISAADASRAQEIAGMVREAITHTRELARGLSPVQLEGGNLPDALRELSRRARTLSGVDCRFHCPKPVLNCDEVLSVHLYRIAQEALANAIKHGEAKRVDIRLMLDEKRLMLAIADNGFGIPAKPRARSGMGLHVMQYRANVVGGTLMVGRNRLGGTSVICAIKNGKGKVERSV